METEFRLEAESGPHLGRSFPVEPGRALTVGRHTRCGIRLTGDGLLSRHHCLLEADSRRLLVRDLRSLNGTFVNGRRLERPDIVQRSAGGAETELHDGDRLAIGGSVFRVMHRTAVRCATCERVVSADEAVAAKAPGAAYICAECRKSWTVEFVAARRTESIACAGCGVVTEGPVDDGEEPYCPICRERQALASVELRGVAATCDLAGLVPAPGLACYRIGRELGRGKQGIVYQAVHRTDDDVVALKVATASAVLDRRHRDLFQREVAVLSRLVHPNIVRLVDFGAAAGMYYYATEFCNAGNFETLSAKHSARVPPPLVWALLEPCAAAMEYAHRQGIVHRDLKPRNILLHLSEGRLAPKIADFGFAKLFHTAGMSGLTLTGDSAGTPHFMPREQLTNYKHFEPVSDVWSLAATFYYLLCGTQPLGFGDDRDPLEVILNDEPTPLAERRVAGLSAKEAAAIDRGLSTDVSMRPQSIAEFFCDVTGRALST